MQNPQIMQVNSPIILFLYNRYNESKQTINSLSQAKGANTLFLKVYIDGPKTKSDNLEQHLIINHLKTVGKHFGKIEIVQRKKNLGLGKSIIAGLNEIFQMYDRVIVLEDDIVVNSHFIDYFNDALEEYKDSDIYHISSWSPEILSSEKKTYKTKYMACWGWATWKTKWESFSKDSKEIIDYFERNPHKLKQFNFNNKLYNQVIANHKKEIDTWAVFWYYSIFRNSGYCINPTHSIIRNIGLNNGTNHIKENITDIMLNLNFKKDPVSITSIKTLKNHDIRIRIFFLVKNYFLKPLDVFWRIFNL